MKNVVQINCNLNQINGICLKILALNYKNLNKDLITHRISKNTTYM